jgi:ribonuclease R
VHITALKNDYYKFDPVRHMLAGERSGKTFNLGDVVQVKVARVDLDERKIDLVMAGAEGDTDMPPRKKPRSKGAKGGKGAKPGNKDKAPATTPAAKAPAKPRAKKTTASKNKGKRRKANDSTSLREQVAKGVVTAPANKKPALKKPSK